MDLSQILHPEILHNRRGDPWRRQNYFDGMGKITFNTEGLPAQLHDSLRSENRLIVEHLVFCKKFVERRAPTYFLTESFLSALKSIDREIPFALLPDDFLAYFAFPPGAIDDGKLPIEGAYVYLGRDPFFRRMTLLPHEKIFWVYTIQTPPPDQVSFFGKLYLEISNGTTFTKLLNQLDFEGRGENQTPKEVEMLYRAILNGVLYLHSEEPALEHLKAHHSDSRSRTQTRKLKARLGGKINLTTVPVTLVNFKFPGREPVYVVSQTQVRGHFRWQRCGEGHSKVKLIWIDEHARQYSQFTGISSSQTAPS